MEVFFAFSFFYLFLRKGFFFFLKSRILLIYKTLIKIYLLLLPILCVFSSGWVALKNEIPTNWNLSGWSIWIIINYLGCRDELLTLKWKITFCLHLPTSFVPTHFHIWLRSNFSNAVFILSSDVPLMSVRSLIQMIFGRKRFKLSDQWPNKTRWQGKSDKR